jgi:hypothetical protein
VYRLIYEERLCEEAVGVTAAAGCGWMEGALADIRYCWVGEEGVAPLMLCEVLKVSVVMS